MFRNYLLIALRNINRQKAFSLINILGLSIGISCSILIFLWITDELSFDRYHENAENIYRVYEKQYYSGGEEFLVFATPEPLAATMKETFPEIVNATRLNLLWEKLTIRYEDKVFNESRGYASDQATLEMFTYPFIYGDPSTALAQPYSIVMTRDMAARYFGKEKPVGKTIQINNKYVFTVTGVMENVPVNSHVRWDFLVPFEFFLELWDYPRGQWGSNSFRTYIQLQPGITEENMEGKIIDLIQKHLEESATELYLQPLLETHLHSIWGGGPVQYVKIFSIVAFFILVIACINFMNLATARSGRRAKEVGIRKATGAKKSNLVLQFYGESFFLTLLALVIAILLVQVFVPPFNNLAGKEIHFSFLARDTWLLLLLMTLFTGFFAGSYPALFLSSYKTVEVLKGIARSGSTFFRKFLVITQFIVSIALIICTIAVYKQLHYIRNKDLGLDKNNIIYFPMRDFSSGYLPMKQSLKSLPGIDNVTATNHVPVSITNSTSVVDWDNKDPDLEILFQLIFVDFDYFETFRLEMKEGRMFSQEFPSDSVNYIINEESVRRMGIENPVGKRLSLWNNDGIIAGVVKDFNFHHLTRAIDPLLLLISPSRFGEVVIRLTGGDMNQTMKQIEKVWYDFHPGEPFEYRFLDEDFDQMYRAEERIGKIFNYFAILAIFISCLGLFGLASFMAEQRTREIGIRKTHGSSVLHIFLLMNRSFVWWILLANLIAWPVAGVAMNRWLQGYAYKTSLSWWIFVLAGLVSLLITIITTTYQSLRAANTNPAETLRYE